MVSIDRSHVATPYGAGSFACKISFSCQIFWFSRLGVGSLHCELSWAIRLSAASVVAPYYKGSHYMQMLFWRKILKMSTVPVRGSYSPILKISYVKPIEKYLVFELRIGTKCQLHSQSKLTFYKQRCENKEIRNFKSKWTRFLCVGTSDLSNDTKKHTTKSRETIPLHYMYVHTVH
jgi:hypothetical protein